MGVTNHSEHGSEFRRNVLLPYSFIGLPPIIRKGQKHSGLSLINDFIALHLVKALHFAMYIYYKSTKPRQRFNLIPMFLTVLSVVISSVQWLSI